MKNLGLDLFSARLAIGSLWLVSAFVALCGVANVFPFVEGLSETKTWDAIMVIPVAVVAYSLGLVVIHSTSALTESPATREQRITEFVSMSRLGNPVLSSRLETLGSELAFVRALVPTVLVLSISVAVSAVRLLTGGQRLVSVLAAGMFLIVLPFVALLMRAIVHERAALVAAALPPQG
jgi:hypothetical protein